MSRKDVLLELTDADLEVVYGGSRCFGDYPYLYDNTDGPYFFASSNTTNSQSNDGFINVPIESDNNSYTSNKGLLDGFSLF